MMQPDRHILTYQNAHAIHMLSFCLGGILWYWLFFRSRTVPRALSAWGIAGLALLLPRASGLAAGGG